MRSMMDPTKPNPEHEIQELLRTMGPWQHLSMVGKKRAGRLLDGVQHDGMPA